MTQTQYPIRHAACPSCAMPALQPIPAGPQILTGQCASQWWADSGTSTYRSPACEELERRGQKIHRLTDGLVRLIDHLTTPPTH